jgi:hypothetical protein
VSAPLPRRSMSRLIDDLNVLHASYDDAINAAVTALA